MSALVSDFSLASLRQVLRQHSRFLFEAVESQPDWLEALTSAEALAAPRTRIDYTRELASEDFLPERAAQFRRKSLLRIYLRDVLGLSMLSEATREISDLADALLDWTYEGVRQRVEGRLGRAEEPTGEKCPFSIVSLGKLGGQELNYSSDIDLVFVYGSPGETRGGRSVTHKEFFGAVAQELSQFLATYTAAGICYRVDLRLRPDGGGGELTHSLEAMRDYYQRRARDWELQMMIKARVAAGESAPGQRLIDFVEPLTYQTSTDFSAIEAVSETRLRLNEKLAARRLRPGVVDIKLARGGIRDIEFLVQCLQRLHGGREQWLRHGGTLLSLGRLHDKGLIAPSDYFQLIEAYEFLRHLEHRLQIRDDRQTHTLPQAGAELESLAARMPLLDPPRANHTDALLAAVKRHFEAVSAIYDKIVHQRRLAAPPVAQAAPALAAEKVEPMPASESVPLRLERKLQPLAPRLLAQLQQGALRRHMDLLERWIETAGDRLAGLERDEVLTNYVLDIVSHSPWLAEEILREPERLEELGELRQRPTASRAWAEQFSVVPSMAALRRLYRKELFLLGCESLCLGAPVFGTMSRMSQLADLALAAAYRVALADVARTGAPDTPRMMVVALGRLGSGEFDVASDADLVFILPDEDAGDLEFWKRVAERLIEMLSAHTGDGSLFRVDTRLRPFGREGELVQSERSYLEYFSQRAQTWEGIAYMKARAVAGDTERATKFLNDLQKVDWRRYGQSHRSRQQLRDMRTRLEREQGKSHALKAGFGGYYDIDFLLMYLRLKSAGIFFKVLNTPERIDVIEQIGHLERDDAEFLREAATIFRAVDHGIRLFSGQPSDTLPEPGPSFEAISEMVVRWTPEAYSQQPLREALRVVQARTRETFDRLFS
ncbi:MAG: glutamine-synthetase adenylyltransferase [Bryobacter sp.]|nr:glutamine-synthetase adenylyltransferase [Bryobacter sp.]